MTWRTAVPCRLAPVAQGPFLLSCAQSSTNRATLLAAFIALLGTLAHAASNDLVDWVRSVNGELERNTRGEVVAVDLTSAWISDDDLDLLAATPTLERINLSHTWITDLSIERLRGLENVRELNLFYCDYLTDTAVLPLKGWKNLEVLNLEGTDVTSRSFEHLAGITSLRSLRVGFSRVEDAGFENLGPLTLLEEFGFGGNKMSGRALPLLKMLPALKKVDLGGLQRTDSGLWGMALSDFNLDSLADLEQLEVLALNDTNVGDAGLRKLTGLTRLRELDLSGTKVSLKGRESLAALSQLKKLRLWQAERIDNRAAGALLELKSLQTVDLAETGFGDSGLLQLAGSGSLRQVYVGGSEVTPDGVRQFRGENPNCEITWWPKPADVERYQNIAP